MLVFWCKSIILVVPDRGWDLKLTILITSLPTTTPKTVAAVVVFTLVVWVVVFTVVCGRNNRHNNRRRRQVKCCYCHRRHVKSTCVERIPARERNPAEWGLSNIADAGRSSSRARHLHTLLSKPRGSLCSSIFYVGLPPQYSFKVRWMVPRYVCAATSQFQTFCK